VTAMSKTVMIKCYTWTLSVQVHVSKYTKSQRLSVRH